MARFADGKEIFTHFFETNEWRSEESRSGAGSTIEYTRNIREKIPRLLKSLGVKKILDAPCGDYNWFRAIKLGKGISYIGGDIVEALVTKNQEEYGDPNTSFIHIDVTKDRLPKADLWLCRDCLFHLADDQIFGAINNFLDSEITYLLTSTHPECNQNKNISTGCFRLLNLELPPFSFCKPILHIDDWIEGYPLRRLALWERKELSKGRRLGLALS